VRIAFCDRTYDLDCFNHLNLQMKKEPPKWPLD
jgi:hypothetical protein